MVGERPWSFKHTPRGLYVEREEIRTLLTPMETRYRTIRTNQYQRQPQVLNFSNKKAKDKIWIEVLKLMTTIKLVADDDDVDLDYV